MIPKSTKIPPHAIMICVWGNLINETWIKVKGIRRKFLYKARRDYRVFLLCLDGRYRDMTGKQIESLEADVQVLKLAGYQVINAEQYDLCGCEVETYSDGERGIAKCHSANCLIRFPEFIQRRVPTRIVPDILEGVFPSDKKSHTLLICVWLFMDILN